MPLYLDFVEGTLQGGDKLTQQNGHWVASSDGSSQHYVIADDLNDGQAEILATAGVPALHSVANGRRVIDRKAKEHRSIAHPLTGVETALWIVTIKTDSNVDSEDESDPTALVPKVRWWGEMEEELLEKDAITGDAIQTVPGEPILITTEFPIAVLEVKRFEAHSFDPDTILDYSGRTNQNAFYGAPTGTALMMPIQAEETTIEGTKYSDVTYRVKFKIKEDPDNPGSLLEDTWMARPLHHGFKYYKSLALPVQVYRDASGQPATINLDENGMKLADGADPVFLAFNRFSKADFDPLSLGPFP